MLKRSERSSSTTSSVPLDCVRVELSPFAISLLQREVEEHGRAAAFFAVHRDRAAMLLHDGLGDAESEPRSRGLGREERIEQLRERAARDADAGVDGADLLDLEPRCAAVLGPPLVAVAALLRTPVVGPALLGEPARRIAPAIGRAPAGSARRLPAADVAHLVAE